MEERIHAAIDKLRSLREGDLAVLDLIDYGPAAIGPLRNFLFAREPSGLYQPRCQAVDALAALGARDVLLDFMVHPRTVPDPVEETGEEAVTNAVARALMKWPDEEVFALLLSASRRKVLAGVVEALGCYRRIEAMPALAGALAEDFSRPEAEEAFRKMGAQAGLCLLRLADLRTPSPDTESESSRRRRRSALRLFEELNDGNELPAVVLSLTWDADSWISQTACSICLPRVSGNDRESVAKRLIELLSSQDWRLRAEVEELLIRHFAVCRFQIERSLDDLRDPAATSLHKVIGQAGSTPVRASFLK